MTEYRVGDLVRVANPAEARDRERAIGGDPMQAWFDQVGIVTDVVNTASMAGFLPMAVLLRLPVDTLLPWKAEGGGLRLGSVILATVAFPSDHVQHIVSFFERIDHV